jgi:hypothetical protein
MPLTRQEIRGAVACEKWQAIRLSLKGLSTQSKLNNCQRYLEPMSWKTRDFADAKECCNYETRSIQVLNYLTALSRGGQIDLVPAKYQYKDTVGDFLDRKEYRILK